VQALAFQMMEALEQSGALNTFEHVGMATMDAIPTAQRAVSPPPLCSASMLSKAMGTD
jgi:hypothetical protein